MQKGISVHCIHTINLFTYVYCIVSKEQFLIKKKQLCFPKAFIIVQCVQCAIYIQFALCQSLSVLVTIMTKQMVANFAITLFTFVFY